MIKVESAIKSVLEKKLKEWSEDAKSTSNYSSNKDFLWHYISEKLIKYIDITLNLKAMR